MLINEQSLKHKLLKSIRLNPGNVEKIEECLISIFDENIEFDPRNYRFLYVSIITSPFIGRSDKIKLMNYLSKLGIYYKGVMTYDKKVKMDALIEFYLNTNDVEFLQCLINSGCPLKNDSLVYAFQNELNLNFIHWLWDSVKTTPPNVIKKCLVTSVTKKNIKQIQYIIQLRNVDLKKISWIKSRGSIMGEIIKNKDIQLAEYFLSKGLNIEKEISKCICKCIYNNCEEILNLIVRYYSENPNIHTLSVARIASPISYCGNFKMLEILSKIIEGESVLNLLESLINAEWYSGALLILKKLPSFTESDAYYVNSLNRMMGKIKKRKNNDALILYTALYGALQSVYFNAESVISNIENEIQNANQTDHENENENE